MTTPTQLADIVDRDPKLVRQWLRDHPLFGKLAPGKGEQWVLTTPMVRYVSERSATARRHT